MSQIDSLRNDIEFVTRVTHHHDQPLGVPAIYFLWAAIVLVGFSLPDFFPRAAGPYWFVAGIGGGLLSAWLGNRHARKAGFNNQALNKRYAMHWGLGALAFMLSVLPLAVGRVDLATGVNNFLLVGGVIYGLAGVHLERPLLWSGALMLAAYIALTLFTPPWTWTITVVTVAAALPWAGFAALRKEGADDVHV